MAYKIIVSPKAQAEIENALDYYEKHSKNVPLKFANTIQDTYRILSINPYYKNLYKNFRSITLKGFPFILMFIIDEDDNSIMIISCFHTSQNPRKYPT